MHWLSSTTSSKTESLPPRINRLDYVDEIIGLDFETYWDNDYTLKKLSTSEYVRDERFKAHSVGLCSTVNPKPQYHRTEQIPEALAAIDWSRSAVLCHHTHFDGLILNERYGIKPAYYFDTLSMALGKFGKSRSAGLDDVAEHMGIGNKMPGVLGLTKGVRDLSDIIHMKLSLYCRRDVLLMWQIFLQLLPTYPIDELDIIDIAIRCFTEPKIIVDLELANKELETELEYRRTLFDSLAPKLGLPDGKAVKTLMSSRDKFAALLRSYDIDVEMKEGKKGPIPAIAKSDVWFQDMILQFNGTALEPILEARLLAASNIGPTRAERLIKHALPALPIYYNYCRAHTFRFTGGDKLNPQNFPAGRKGQSAGLRRALTAPRGLVFVTVDSSQNEDRSNCWLAGQIDVLDLYRNNGDPYSELASRIYGYAVDKKNNPNERGLGKVARLGLGFQCGGKTFRRTVQIGALGPAIPDFTLDQAFDTVNIYRHYNDAIVHWWETLSEILDQMTDEAQGNGWELHRSYMDEPVMCFYNDRVEMPNGLCIWYRDLKRAYNEETGFFETTFQFTPKKRAYLYGGKFCENLTQSIGRQIIGEQMLEISRMWDVVMMTHDEVTFLAPESEAEAALEKGIEIMSTSPKWCQTLPLSAEGDFGTEYTK